MKSRLLIMFLSGVFLFFLFDGIKTDVYTDAAAISVNLPILSTYQPPKGSDKAEYISGLNPSNKKGTYYITQGEEYIETTRFVLFIDKGVKIPVNVIELINYIMDMIEEETAYKFYVKKAKEYESGMSTILEQYFDTADKMKKIDPTKVGIVVCSNQDGPYALGEKGVLLQPENITLLDGGADAIIHELLHVVFFRNGKSMDGAFDEGFATYYTERIVKKATRFKDTYETDLTNYPYAIDEKTMEQLYIVHEQGVGRYKLGFRLMNFIIEKYGDKEFRKLHKKVTEQLDDTEYKASTTLVAETIKKEFSNNFFINFAKWHKLNMKRFGDKDISLYGQWNIDHGYLYKYYGNETHIVIPDKVEEIGFEAFAYCQSLISVVIPKSVNAIAGGAFFKCNNLKEISIPQNVTKIYLCAFDSCSSLEKVKLPNNLKEISLQMFYGCTSLKDITLPNSIKIIEDTAFTDCISLETINLPEGLEKIGYSAFRGCTSLKRINMPNSIKVLSTQIFNNCSSLEEVILPNNLKRIENMMFWGCTSLKKIKIPDGVTVIGDLAFQSTGIRNIKIPSTVTRIENSAFTHCKNLKKIEIPESVISIHEDAFYGCENFFIQGIKGSYAEKYANQYDIIFLVKYSSINRMKQVLERSSLF